MSSCKLFFTLLFTLCLLSPLQADELLRNGDFEYGTNGWKGDRRVIEHTEENKVCEVEADDEIEGFYQEDIDVEDLKDIVLTFKYRVSDDYKGRGITMRFKRPDGSTTYRTIKLQGPGKWHEYRWNFREIRGADELTLMIDVLEGEGTVLFDDMSVKPM